MRSVFGLALLAACAPPPLDVDEPSIAFIFPPAEVEPTPIPLQSDCSLSTTVSVDIDNFLVEPFADATEATEGVGHWHAQVSGDPNYFAVPEAFVTITRPAGDVSPGPAILSITATLVDSLHQPVDGDNTTAIAEFTIAQPVTGEICP